MTGYQAPGVYLEDVFPPRAQNLLTGVPAFLGYADPPLAGDPPVPRPRQPVALTLWPQFEAAFVAPWGGGYYLADAVAGFFRNGGLLCYVFPLDVTLPPPAALQAGLTALRGIDAIDLVCAPDIMSSPSMTGPPDTDAITALQTQVLADCQQAGGRFAILDTVLTSDKTVVETQRAALASQDGALYHPWVWVDGQEGSPLFLPPCGHVAGIYARGDQDVGVHKAPANAQVDGALDLRATLTGDDLGELYSRGVNCLRAMPGRGIRVWGARTLSADAEWQSIAARRVFLTIGRWLEQFLEPLTFEPNDVRLRVRIMREVTAYLDGLFLRGALKGRTAEEAFFVKCDSETNPPEVMAAGMVVTSVGVALAAPAEFIVVRVIHGASGVSIQPSHATA